MRIASLMADLLFCWQNQEKLAALIVCPWLKRVFTGAFRKTSGFTSSGKSIS